MSGHGLLYTGCFFLFVYTFKLPLIPQFSPIFQTLWKCYSQKHVHLEKLQMVQWNKILISKKDKEYNTIFQESQNSVIFLLWRFLQRIDQGTVLLRNIPKERSSQGCNHAIGIHCQYKYRFTSSSTCISEKSNPECIKVNGGHFKKYRTIFPFLK